MSSRQRWLVLTFAALAGLVVTALLGRWQLSRGEMREHAQLMIDAKRQLPALETSAVAALPMNHSDEKVTHALHRTAQLRGHWLVRHTVYLDNRQMMGRPGFYVLTPFQLEGSSKVLLVQRGWIARNFVDRAQLPQVSTPDGPIEINGRLAAPPARLLDLGPAVKLPNPELGDTSGQSAPVGAIRQNLDLPAFAQETSLALMPFTLVQTNPSSGEGAVAAAKDGLLRDWPLVNSGASKNYGYAAQWFALSLLIAVLYGWFQFGKAYVAKNRS